MTIKRSQIKIEADRKRDGSFYGLVGTSAEWAAYPRPLGLGEMGYATDTGQLKIGNGVSLWTALSALNGSGGGAQGPIGPQGPPGLTGPQGPPGSGGGGGAADSFETVNKNLSASGATISYTGGGDLSSIVYASGVTKTLTYGVNGLASITLSGSTPSGIQLIKTLNYTSGELTGWTYS